MASHAPHASQARRSFYTHDEDDNLTDEQRTRRARLHRVLVIIKITIFVLIWIFFSIFMIITPPYEPHEIVVSLDPNELRSVDLAEKPTGKYIYVKLKGKIDEDATYRSNRAGKNQSYVIVSAATFDSGTNRTLWSAKDWKVYLDDSEKYKVATVKNSFKIEGFDSKSLRAMDTHHDEFEEGAEERVMRASGGSDSPLKVSLLNTDDKPTALSVTANPNPLDVSLGVMYAMLLLCFLYVLIIFDIADRTFAALLAATTGIGILCMLGERPSLEQIISWIDMDTLMLLFGMMIMVAVLAETGVFDYMSVFAYHMSKGQPWVLIFLLCMLTVMLSAFLDNVTIIMLMVPVIIRLTECMGLRTTTVLITVALFSNIGGALTPVGDPPNVIIATNQYVVAEGVDFITFVAHMFPGVFFSIVVAWIFIFVVLRHRLFVGSDEQMRESIKNLTKTAAKFNEPRPSEEKMRRDILQRIEELKEQYRRKEVAKTFGLQPASNFIETLAEMEARYKIRNKPLLIKCCIALVFAVILFLMHSLPFMRGVTLAWAAMLAAMLLLILANKPDMDAVLDHVEWSTLLFFAGLFVLVEVVSELGLIEWVGDLTILMIQSVGNEHRVVTAIMLVLWISAVFSAFVDNIPIVTMMLKLAIKLSTNDELNLPLMPLIWAISMGVCFGGNGTLIAASSNVVAAGIANQHGYKITFMEFFIYGFPVMLLSDVVATIYLLIAHELNEKLIALRPNESHNVVLDEEPMGKFVRIDLKGNIDALKTMNPSQASSTDPFIAVTLQTMNIDTNETLWQSNLWSVYLVTDNPSTTSTVKTMLEVADWNKKSIKRSRRDWSDADIRMQVSLLNLHKDSTGVSLTLVSNPIDPQTGTWIGAFLLLLLYVLIAFEITDRAFAAILVSATAIGILCMMDLRPTFQTILSWIDIDTLMLLFGMMVMVAILSDTGLFDYLSLFAYRLSQGKIWFLLFYLYMFTGLLSALLDNVTMVLMIVPVTIRLCEAVGLHTILVVINIVIFSNVGGTLTPVGDPPNMIIATNKDVINAGVEFGNFTLHMFPGVILSMLIIFLIMYFTTRNIIYTGRASQLRQSIDALERVARNMKDKEREDALRRISELKERLKGHEANTTTANMDFDSNLNDMKRKYKIKDKVLLLKCVVAFVFAVSMFLLHSVPSLHGISLAWAAVLAALLLLILADRPDVDKVLERVEWSTLIFFAGLFVFTESLVELGLIERVSNMTIDVIKNVNEESQLLVSILLVLWISAIGASFVGNIPITTMMLKLIINLASNEKLKLPLQPLVWAIAFGACFGGNGTLIGASANVVSAGIATQYGHNIDFKHFFYYWVPRYGANGSRSFNILTYSALLVYLALIHLNQLSYTFIY